MRSPMVTIFSSCPRCTVDRILMKQYGAMFPAGTVYNEMKALASEKRKLRTKPAMLLLSPTAITQLLPASSSAKHMLRRHRGF
jgi:hypothetical protein